MTNEEIKTKLINAGVKNLKAFGYPEVNNDNILTDIVYGGFFKNMLDENIGQATNQVDDVINELLAILEKKQYIMSNNKQILNLIDVNENKIYTETDAKNISFKAYLEKEYGWIYKTKSEFEKWWTKNKNI